MGLISTEVEVTIGAKNLKHYEELGYEIPKHRGKNYKMVVPRGTKIMVKVEHLTKGSRAKVDVKCDGCGEIYKLSYSDYINQVHEGKIFCNNCAKKIGNETRKINNLKNKTTLYQWFVDNDLDVNEYWDFDKNGDLKPTDILYTCDTKVWIKCTKTDYHGSYEIRCGNFTLLNQRCPYCSSQKTHPKDSLGQYIIDNYGEDFLWRVWSNKNEKSPFEYMPKTSKYIWWKCLDGKHEDYKRKGGNAYMAKYACPKCFEFPRGKYSPNWNPNLTQEYREQTRRVEGYLDWAKEVYKKDDYTCQCCNKRGGKLNAHHLDGYNWDKEHRVDVNNGTTLCEDCHKEFHHIYGYGNNTKEQYEEWIKTKTIKEV